MIPKTFYQSWNESLPGVVHTQNSKFVDGRDDVTYKLYTMTDIMEYLRTSWGEEYVELCKSYQNPAHKVDLWRYCILYEHGGIYMDADAVLLSDVFEFVDKNDMIFVTNNRGVLDIYNGFLATYPKNPIFKRMIDFMLSVGTDFNNDNDFNRKYLYQVVDEYIHINMSNNTIKQDYTIQIEAVPLKVCLFVDMRFNEVVVNAGWVEHNRYCPVYYHVDTNRIQLILTESNHYYPYLPSVTPEPTPEIE